MKHIPNALTIARIVVTPVLLYLLFMDTLIGYVGALTLFVLGAISDYFDGQLARKYGVGTSFGQYLDPLADKVLVLGTFFALVFILPEAVPLWAVVVIAIRDVAVTLLRSWANRSGKTLKTSLAAKFKTTVQLTYLILTLVLLTASRLPGFLGEYSILILSSGFMYWLLVAVALITAGTGIAYFYSVNQPEAESAS